RRYTLRLPHAVPHMPDERLAVDVREHFSGKARRAETGRDYGNHLICYSHKPFISFVLWTVRSSLFGIDSAAPHGVVTNQKFYFLDWLPEYKHSKSAHSPL